MRAAVPAAPMAVFGMALAAFGAGCATDAHRIEAPGAACVDVRWPLTLPFGAGRPLPGRVGTHHPPLYCEAHADCPPGAWCAGEGTPRLCRTDAQPEPGGSLAELYGVPRFDVEVVAGGDGHGLRLSGLPTRADFALCSIYTCPVDADLLADDISRCLLDTRRLDLSTSHTLALPAATASSRATAISVPACQARGGSDAEEARPLALRPTPTGFSAMCVAYQPSGVAGASDIIALRPDEVGALAGDSYQETCTAATTGSACLHERAGASQLGICVGAHCCIRCASSVPSGSRVEQACASLSGLVVDTADERYTQLGYAQFGVCLDRAGRAVCLDDRFIPADAPSAACEPRAEPRADDPFPRAYDADGDGISVDLDCDDDDATRGAIEPEATADGIDQDCDGRVDEVTVIPCPGAPEMVAAWDGAMCIDRYEASRPDASADSPGEVAGAAGSVAGVMPWVGVGYSVAAAACAAAGKRLCPPTVFRQNCLHASGSPFPYGPSYDAAACNGADGLFGALMPTGTLLGCAGLSGAVDLVGNAGEWVAGGEVLGGSYQSGTAELSCQAARRYGEGGDAFAAPWVGFRCCKAPPGGADD